ncbi:MAG: hypothetical protein OXR62_11140 [Ahrensia sp.]|nr:hypothetical protein [Ahrensia sp.]
MAFGELLKRGFDVYATLVDDQQIDCVLRSDGEEPRYVDLQIKARSKQAKNPGMFSALDIRKPRENFFFMFYSEAADTYWVMPSLDIVTKGSTNKRGKHSGKHSLVFTNTLASGEVKPRPKWLDYQDAFHLLSEALGTDHFS